MSNAQSKRQQCEDCGKKAAEYKLAFFVTKKYKLDDDDDGEVIANKEPLRNVCADCSQKYHDVTIIDVDAFVAMVDDDDDTDE